MSITMQRLATYVYSPACPRVIGILLCTNSCRPHYNNGHNQKYFGTILLKETTLSYYSSTLT